MDQQDNLIRQGKDNESVEEWIDRVSVFTEGILNMGFQNLLWRDPASQYYERTPDAKNPRDFIKRILQKTTVFAPSRSAFLDLTWYLIAYMGHSKMKLRECVRFVDKHILFLSAYIQSTCMLSTQGKIHIKPRFWQDKVCEGVFTAENLNRMQQMMHQSCSEVIEVVLRQPEEVRRVVDALRKCYKHMRSEYGKFCKPDSEGYTPQLPDFFKDNTPLLNDNTTSLQMDRRAIISHCRGT